LKKPVSLVRFWFYKSKTKKTEPNRTQTEKTIKQTESNRFEPFLSYKPNRTETGQFEPVSVWFRFFFKKIGLVIFFL